MRKNKKYHLSFLFIACKKFSCPSFFTYTWHLSIKELLIKSVKPLTFKQIIVYNLENNFSTNVFLQIFFFI